MEPMFPRSKASYFNIHSSGTFTRSINKFQQKLAKKKKKCGVLGCATNSVRAKIKNTIIFLSKGDDPFNGGGAFEDSDGFLGGSYDGERLWSCDGGEGKGGNLAGELERNSME